MTKWELEYLSKPPIHYGFNPTWIKAFHDYNKDHPNDRPMDMRCVPCYIKVYFHCKKKYDVQPE